MEVTVYLDIVFLVNYIINVALLVWYRMVTGRKKYWQCLLIGMAGAFFSVLNLALYMYLTYTVHWQKGAERICTLFAILTLFVLLFLENRGVNAGKAGRKRWYYLLAVVIYCSVLAVGRKTQVQNIPGCYLCMSFVELLVRTIFFMGTAPVVSFLCKVQRIREGQYYRIALEKNGIKKEGIGFLDTGNGLYHPWTKEPVVVAEHKTFAPFFEKEEFQRQERLLRFAEPLFTEKDWIGMEKIVWIPYRSVGKASGVLPGVYFDHLWIYEGKNAMDHPHILVAFCKEKICSKEEYQLILHRECVKSRT